MRKLLLCALIAFVWPFSSAAARQAEDPLPTDLREHVEVGLVILDAVAG